MKMKQWIHLGLFVVIALFYSSCATTHPNEALIVGEWKPIKAEKYFTPEEEELLKKAQEQSTATRPTTEGDKPAASTGSTAPSTASLPSGTDPGRGGDRAGGKNPADELNRLIQAETRTNIVIYPDHTAAKFYRSRTVKATWKLKGKGTVLIAKDLEKKEKYRIDILEVDGSKMVVVENLPVGGIKITYQKINEAQSDEAK
ncbi:MAG: hypothetical protein IH596_08825 [Bacteroidales bacterium]|nr:hypothetical protein [Bacteroidales bacterium]